MPQQPIEPVALPKTILVVDDQTEVRKFVFSVLAEKNYNVLMAGRGEDALQQSRTYKGPIHLLISDIQMPEMTGVELATKIGLERPEMKVMLMSGFQSGLLLLNEGWHFLHKPFIPSQLLSMITAVLAQPQVPNLDEHQ